MTSKKGDEPRLDESAIRRLDGLATGAPGSKPASRRKELKVKSTYSLSVRLKRLIDTTADDIGIDSSQLVEKLLTNALRGVSRPTIPAALRRQFDPGDDAEDAA